MILAESLTDPSMPVWIRNLIWFAAALGAIVGILGAAVTIWNRLHMTSVMGKIGASLTTLSKEMTPNGGASMKDQMAACAADSKRALELAIPTAKDSKDAAKDSKEALELTVKLGQQQQVFSNQQKAYLEDISEVKKDVRGLEGDVKRLDAGHAKITETIQSLRNHFDRFAIHLTKNTLNHSALMKELEAIEAEEQERKRFEKQQQST